MSKIPKIPICRIRDVKWFFSVLIATLCFASIANASGLPNRTYWTVIPFVAEEGTKAPSWVCYSLTSAIDECLMNEVNADPISWQNLRAFYTEENIPPLDNAWSDSELSAIADKCGMKIIIVGRYELAQGQLNITYRIWTALGLKQGKASVRLSHAHYEICDLVENIAQISGLSKRKHSTDLIERPLVANSRSFEMLGRIAAASAMRKHKEEKRLVCEWVKIDSHSFLATYKQALIRWADKPGELAYRLEKMAQKRPHDRSLWGELGWERESAGDSRGALIAYQKTLKLDSQDPLTQIDIARVLERLGKVSEARKLRARIDSLKCDWSNHLSIGHYYYLDENYDSSITHYKAAIRLGGKCCYILNCMGRALACQKKWRQAIEAWELSLKINQKNAYVLDEVGYAYIVLRRWGNAELYLKKALKADEKRIRTRSDLAYVLLKQNKYKEAETQAKTVLNLDPKNHQAHRILASVYRRQGKLFKSFNHLLLSFKGSRQTAIKAVSVLVIVFAITLIVMILIIKRHLSMDKPKVSMKRVDR